MQTKEGCTAIALWCNGPYNCTAPSNCTLRTVPYFQPTVQVPMPDKLKLKLIDDWNFITRHSKIVKLPREENIAQLLDRYRQQSSCVQGSIYIFIRV